MTQFSTNIQNLAIELIAEFGSTITVTRYNNEYNPTTGSPYGSATGIFTDGATYPITETDIMLTAAGEGEIKAGDIITFESHATEYTVDTGLSDVSVGGQITLTTGLTQEINTSEDITLVNISETETFTATIVTDSFNNMELAISLLGATSSSSLLKGSDKKVYIAYSDTYTPQVGDNMSYKSKNYRIADVKVMDLQQDTYLYEVRLEI